MVTDSYGENSLTTNCQVVDDGGGGGGIEQKRKTKRHRQQCGLPGEGGGRRWKTNKLILLN